MYERKDEISVTIERIAEQILNDLQECRNEMCFRCGNYINAHLGDCDGCKWKDYDFDEIRKVVVVNG